VFSLSGDGKFIEEFEKLLIDNGVSYSKLSEPKIILKEQREEPKKERRVVHLITAEAMMTFVLSITPTLLKIIYDWYRERKGEGKIIIRTKNSTFEFNARTKEVIFTEKRSKKKLPKKRRD
jgi:hypothetical protein